MSFLLSILGITGIGFLMHHFWRVESRPDRIFFLTGWFLKIFAGICLGLIYLYYYETGDTFTLYTDAQRLSDIFFVSPGHYFSYLFFEEPSNVLTRLYDGAPRSLIFIKMLSFINLFAFDSYWVTSIYLSSFSFLGAWFLVSQVRKILPDYYKESLVAFLMIPSFVFWSSGIIKESVAMMALLILAGITLKIVNAKFLNLYQYLLGAACVILVWQLKYYWAALFFVCSGSSIAMARINVLNNLRSVWLKVVVWVAVASFGLAIVSFSRVNLNFGMVMRVTVENYKAFSELSMPGDAIHYESLEPTVYSFLVNTPKALTSGLFRPSVFEATTLFQAIVAIENLLLLVLAVLAVYRLGKEGFQRLDFSVVSLIAYCLLLCTFLALSTPNFGTLARYRIGFLPFFAFLVLCQSGLLKSSRLRLFAGTK